MNFLNECRHFGTNMLLPHSQINSCKKDEPAFPMWIVKGKMMFWYLIQLLENVSVCLKPHGNVYLLFQLKFYKYQI